MYRSHNRQKRGESISLIIIVLCCCLVSFKGNVDAFLQQLPSLSSVNNMNTANNNHHGVIMHQSHDEIVNNSKIKNVLRRSSNIIIISKSQLKNHANDDIHVNDDDDNNNIHDNHDNESYSVTTNSESQKRRTLITSTIMASLSSLLIQPPKPSYADIEGVATPSFLNDPDVNAQVSSSGDDNNNNNNEGVKLYTTKSGLKYIELREGSGRSPQYGNFVSISYKAYVKLPEGKSSNSNLQEYDSDSSYLTKHGNGRTIPGLDEGLHTMKVGGKRRIIIPPKLGYVGPGVLGPLPAGPLGRYKLNKLLDEMVAVRGGNVVFDVELRSVVEDEADQGYYEDDSLSPDQFNTLRINLQQKAKESRSGFDLLDAV